MTKKELSKINLIDKGIEGFFSTLSNYKKIVTLLLILLLIIAFLPIELLVLRDYRRGKYLKSWRVNSGDKFIVQYTHSVEQTPVIENYLIEDENIILVDAYFHSFGAGLPATTPYKFKLIENGFKIYDINEKIDNLIYRTGSQGADHILYINNEENKFLDFSDPRKEVGFTIERSKLLLYLIREGLN